MRIDFVYRFLPIYLSNFIREDPDKQLSTRNILNFFLNKQVNKHLKSPSLKNKYYIEKTKIYKLVKKLCAFGPENISKNQRSKKFLRLRIVTKLERTAIDGVESGISSRIVKSNAPRKESRNRALPFCNSPLIRVENCLQLFG